jgi:hypothetical protein
MAECEPISLPLLIESTAQLHMLVSRFSSLGTLSLLSYEIREKIWLEFIPKLPANAASPPLQTSFDADLRVLQASRALNREISSVIYPKARLHLDLSPCAYEDETRSLWCTVRFIHPRHGGLEESPIWRLETTVDGRDHRFDYFPWRKIDGIDISLSAPNDLKHLIWMWRNVMRTTELLRHDGMPPAMSIRLHHDENADPECQLWTAKLLSDPLSSRYSYDLLVLPFANMMFVEHLTVEPSSSKLRQKMVWTGINEVLGLVRRRNDYDGREAAQDKLWTRVMDEILGLQSVLTETYFKWRGTILGDVALEIHDETITPDA